MYSSENIQINIKRGENVLFSVIPAKSKEKYNFSTRNLLRKTRICINKILGKTSSGTT